MSATLKEAIQAIYDKRGTLTPPIVLQEASDPAHPLHGRFEWDDTVAAHKYRLVQARSLIRQCRIVVREATELERAITARAFPAVPRGNNEYEYKPVMEVATDPFTAKLVLQEAERRWKQLHREYGHLREFIEMVQGDLGDGEAA